MKAVIAALGLFCAAAFSDGADAQVQGVCVSGCNIPSAPAAPTAPMPPDPRFNIIGAAAVVQGEVQLRTPDGRVLYDQVAFKDAIPFGSTVSTGPSGKIQILLADETSFTIGPNSEMVLDEFVYDPATSTGKITATVVKGLFRFITGKVARKDPENIKVKLNVGTIGIRGTDFDVDVDPDGSGYILLNKGEVYLTEYDTERVYTLHPGQRLRYENFKIVGIE